MSGGDVLDDLESFLARFVAYPSEHARVAHALWIAHAWLMDRWDSTPRIAFLSTEPGSGKTRALEVTAPLVPNPVHAVNVSPAYLFRRVSDTAGLPTVLYDEIDTVFGPKAKDNEDLRGLLNAGHRRGATAGRCEVRGKTVVTVDYPAYCAVAIAGLNDMPDTIQTRSVVVRMRRRAPHEFVDPWRARIHEAEAAPLKARLATWAASFPATVTWPHMPAEVTDRAADVWEPLLAVAEYVGDDWPIRARVAAVTLVTDVTARAESLGVRLLADLRTVFADKRVMSTEDILAALTAMDEAPWGDLRGKALDARGLASRLRRYGVERTTVNLGGVDRAKGYRADDLADPWSRYLSPRSAFESVTAVTPVTSQPRDDGGGNRVTQVTEKSSNEGGNPCCRLCGKPNLYSRQSIERGICAACVKAGAA